MLLISKFPDAIVSATVVNSLIGLIIPRANTRLIITPINNTMIDTIKKNIAITFIDLLTSLKDIIYLSTPFISPDDCNG
ncbi:hypothetical protein D3C73_972030 [compost metagenome]